MNPDELGNRFGEFQENDIWFDPFLFVKEEDKEQFERYLKLNKVNECA